MHSARTGGADRDDFMPAIMPPHCLAALNAIALEIRAREDATMGRDIAHDEVPQHAIVERVSTLTGNALQRLCIVAAYQLLAWVRRCPVGQEALAAGREARQILLAVMDNVDQILTGREPPGSVADGRLHDGVKIESPVAGDKIAPTLERAGDSHRQVANAVLAVHRFEVVWPGVRDWRIHIRRGCGRRRRVIIDDDDVASAGTIEIDEAGPKDADHHRLDDRQRKSRGDSSVNGVPPHGEHLQARRGSQGMIRGYHPTRSHCGLFLRGK